MKGENSCRTKEELMSIERTMRETPKPGLGGFGKDELICRGTEANLIRFIRNLGWGEATITVKNGAPVMVRNAVQDTKL
jgi:hypothetical protein